MEDDSPKDINGEQSLRVFTYHGLGVNHSFFKKTQDTKKSIASLLPCLISPTSQLA